MWFVFCFQPPPGVQIKNLTSHYCALFTDIIRNCSVTKCFLFFPLLGFWLSFMKIFFQSLRTCLPLKRITVWSSRGPSAETESPFLLFPSWLPRSFHLFRLKSGACFVHCPLSTGRRCTSLYPFLFLILLSDMETPKRLSSSCSSLLWRDRNLYLYSFCSNKILFFYTNSSAGADQASSFPFSICN